MANDRNGQCRSCQSEDLRLVLSLGKMPLANALIREQDLDKEEVSYPLHLALCPECSLLQITETVDPEVLFGEYLYFSSYSETMLAHAKDLANSLIDRKGLTNNSLAVELASNDGYLLQYFVERSIPVLGVEPARNIAECAQARGIPTVCAFFNREAAERIRSRGRAADVIIGNNVLAHVAELNEFVAGVEVLLKPDGIAVFEFPYVRDMIANVEFDTIYHEHLCYYSLTSVRNLFARHGLDTVDVERIPIHGGSLRVFAQRQGEGRPAESVIRLLEEEDRLGMNSLRFYCSFAKNVGTVKQNMLELLEKLKGEGKRIVGYGAAAKGSTLLNYFGVGREHLDYIADRSGHKQGRYMAGNRLPIVAPERIMETRPDYVLILPWNIKDEIVKQMTVIRDWGGQFIVSIPKVTTF